MRLWPAFSYPVEPFGGDPIVFARGEGCWLTDTRGRRYLDGVGALEAMVVGHGRTRLGDVARDQMDRLAFLDVFRYTSEPAMTLAESLSELSPVEDAYVHFTPGGSEAVETAMKAALQYHYLRGEPDRRLFINRHGAFHGVTLGAMSLGASYYAMRNDIYFPQGVALSARAGAIDPHDFGSGFRHTSDHSKIEEMILEVGPETIAGVVVDPMATASGVGAPPVTDLVKIRQVCDKYGTLLIADEVITAWGHTGSLFASSQSGVAPDIVTVSKGLSSGYMPIGATVISGEIASAFSGPDGLFAHGQTYGGHPPACAVALENLAILREESLCDRASQLGPKLIRELQALSNRHENLGFVRGRGLLVGVEILKDSLSAKEFSDRRSAGTAFRLALRDAGLVAIAVHPGSVILLAPPLIISETEISMMVEMFDVALDALRRLDLP
jgi:adenosylmethionine-8-amino-7-oxononanoate aminotransferase